MRELTLAECDFVAGGNVTNLTGITVTHPGLDDYPYAPWDPNDGVGPGGGSGSGGGSHGVDWNECQDRQADTVADSLQQQLQTKADANRIEYGALIYRDAAGNIKATELTPGTNSRWTGMDGKTPQDFGLTSWSQVVGMFHSHPTEVQLPSGWVNVTDPQYEPSNFDEPSSGDWYTTFDFINRNSASLDNFSSYVSFNGGVKEFDAYNNQNQPRDLTNTALGGGAESGDYNPGAACP